ncbi:MAG: gliding motility-associated C-terminal domain-containing protein, partial [Bacteroidota bacterium]
GFQVKIYDRNGREIFQSNQPDFQWDGRDFAGKNVPVGNYTYYIAYVDFTGNRKQRGGGIMLFR